MNQRGLLTQTMLIRCLRSFELPSSEAEYHSAAFCNRATIKQNQPIRFIICDLLGQGAGAPYLRLGAVTMT